MTGLAAGLPPGPDLPSSRQTARWIARPVSFLKSLEERFGDVFTVRLLREPPWVMVSDPALVKQIFTAPTDVLEAGGQKQIFEPIFGPTSVLLSEGEQHLRRRRLLLPPFHASRLSRYEEAMRAAAETEIERWTIGVPAPAAPLMSAIALAAILHAVFGFAGEGGRAAAMRGALERLMDSLTGMRGGLVALGDGARLDEDRFVELRERLARVDELIFEEIRDRRRMPTAGRGEDALSLLLEAGYEDGAPLPDEELRDQLMTLVVAGHETTASSLAWTLERLVRAPEALARVRAEADLGGGPYTDAVIRETLRIRPVFLVVPRLVMEPFRLGDRVIPPGVAVTPSIPLVHRRDEVYADPEAFRPERFLERPPDTYSWIPFGGGVRRCLGAGFSLLEMRVVLSTLLARIELHAVELDPEPAARRLLVMAPARGVPLVLERR